MAIGQLTIQKLHFYTAHFDFTTAQILINCTLKYVLPMIYPKQLYTFKTLDYIEPAKFYGPCIMLAAAQLRVSLSATFFDV